MKTFSQGAEAQPRVVPHLRWWICGLLFVATTINYVDRQALAALNPVVLQKEIGWSAAGFGWIGFSFQLAYAIMFPISGRLIDVFGVRRVMTWAVVVWSLSAMSHAFARTPFHFAMARFSLGLGEAVNFPASIKAIAEWFPKRQRALATGIFNSGTNVGIMLAPGIVFIAVHWHWTTAFLVTGSLGFFWLVAWLAFFRRPGEHPRLGVAERALIESDQDEPSATEAAVRIPWTSMLRFRQAWAFFLAKMFTDPVWWFYLTWLPSYFAKARGLSGVQANLNLFWPYLAADFGSIGGGLLSGYLIKRGVIPGRARLLTLGTFAFGMPAAIAAVFVDDVRLSLAFVSLATLCHQAWSANVFTFASDMFPKRAVGSVVGLGSMCGAIGGMFMMLIGGGMLQWFGSYVPLFLIAGVMHPLAFIVARTLAGASPSPVDLSQLRLEQASRPLIAFGLAGVALGTGLVILVLTQWSTIATAANPSTAAGGLVASSGVLILGALVAWAGRPQVAALR